MTLREQSVAVQEQFVEDQRSYSIFDMLVKYYNLSEMALNYSFLRSYFLEFGLMWM